MVTLISNLQALPAARNRVTFRTEHFEITVDQKKVDQIQIWSDTLESIWKHHFDFYHFAPKNRIQCLLLDDEDFSNGFAYAANSWITLYLPPAHFQLRAATPWFQNVAAHELAHLFTLQKMGADGKFFGLSFEADILSQTDDKHFRGDLWLPWDNTPAWLAEGLAQYGAFSMGYDSLDQRRHLLINQAVMDGANLTLTELATFSADARSSELVYAQGFSLVNWLYTRFGRDKMNQAVANCEILPWTLAFQKALGMSMEGLYDQWLQQVRSSHPQYDLNSKPFTEAPTQLPYLLEAQAIPLKNGFVCYASAKTNAYGMPHLYCKDLSGEAHVVMRDIELPLHPSQDGNSVVFTATEIQPGTGALIRDAYAYTPEQTKLRRLTRNGRIYAATLLKDSSLFAIQMEAGRTRIQKIRGSKVLQTLTAPTGQEFRDITLGRFENELLVTVVQNHSADIFSLNVDSGKMNPILNTRFQEIEPWAQNDTIYFSTDRDGIQNIQAYWRDSLMRVSPKGSRAFTPALYPKGKEKILLVSQYQGEGFRLVELPLEIDTVATALPFQVTDTIPPDSTAKILATYPHSLVTPLAVDRTRMETVGYGGMVGLSYLPSQPLADAIALSNQDTLHEVILNPCPYTLMAGAVAQWMDIGQSQSLFLSAVGNQCYDGDYSSLPYLGNAQFQYTLQMFLPDIVISGNWQTSLLDSPDLNHAYGQLSLFEIVGALQFKWTKEWQAIPLLAYQGMAINFQLDQEISGSGLGLGLGQILDFARVNYSVDQIASGIHAQALALGILSPGDPSMNFNGTWGLYQNLHQKLFFNAEGMLTQTLGRDNAFSHETWLGFKAWFPMRSYQGIGTGYGPVIRSLTLNWNTGLMGLDSADISKSSGINQGIPKQSVRLPSLNRLFPKFSAPFHRAFDSPTHPSLLLLQDVSLTFKVIGVFSHLTYWNFGVTGESMAFNDRIWHIQLSL